MEKSVLDLVGLKLETSGVEIQRITLGH